MEELDPLFESEELHRRMLREKKHCHEQQGFSQETRR